MKYCPNLCIFPSIWTKLGTGDVPQNLLSNTEFPENLDTEAMLFGICEFRKI